MKKVHGICRLFLMLCVVGEMLFCCEVRAAATDHLFGDMSEEPRPCGILAVDNRKDSGVLEIRCQDDRYLVNCDYYEMKIPLGENFLIRVYPNRGYAVKEIAVDRLPLAADESGVYTAIMKSDYSMLKSRYEKCAAPDAKAENAGNVEPDENENVTERRGLDEASDPDVAKGDEEADTGYDRSEIPQTVVEEPERPSASDISYDIVSYTRGEEEESTDSEGKGETVIPERETDQISKAEKVPSEGISPAFAEEIPPGQGENPDPEAPEATGESTMSFDEIAEISGGRSDGESEKDTEKDFIAKDTESRESSRESESESKEENPNPGFREQSIVPAKSTGDVIVWIGAGVLLVLAVVHFRKKFSQAFTAF